jgi:hypothetical protein
MRIVKYIYYFLFFIIFSGCTKDAKDKLVGTWSVDIDNTVVEKNKWYDITSNMLIFKADYTFNGVSFFDPTKGISSSSIGKWAYFSINNKDSVIIDIPDNPISGRYEVIFYKDYEKKLLKIKMKNDSIDFTAAKFLQDFDRNEDW